MQYCRPSPYRPMTTTQQGPTSTFTLVLDELPTTEWSHQRNACGEPAAHWPQLLLSYPLLHWTSSPSPAYKLASPLHGHPSQHHTD